MNVNASLTIPDDCAGLRLDQALARCWPDYSRSRIQEWIKEGAVTVDGNSARPRATVLGGEDVRLTAEVSEQAEAEPQDIELDIRYEDDDLIIVNKSPDMVVHPAAGNPDGTLVNALLHHDPSLGALPRAGIVHRLDKQTSGVMVVAKTLAAHKHLVEALARREIKREYDALVVGHIVAGGTVEAPIGRHARDRQRQAVTPTGKPAVTHYRVEQHFGEHTWLRVSLETGRTHQIRVHMAYIRHPIIGDPVYGGRPKLPPGASDELIERLRHFGRQALHARYLTLAHPTTSEEMRFEAPLPFDMLELIDLLTEYHDGVDGDEDDDYDDGEEAEVIYVHDE